MVVSFFVSSAITAPLASAMTARSLFFKMDDERWKPTGKNFKAVYLSILLVGLGFGFLKVEPIPAIILAQALNGLILPFISIFLIFVINDPILMGKENTNSIISNILMSVVMWVTMIIGLMNIIKAFAKALDKMLPTGLDLILIISFVTLIASIGILFALYNYKKSRLMQIAFRLNSDNSL